jgi:hypothetical protein
MKKSPHKAPAPTPGLVMPRANLRMIELKQENADSNPARCPPSPVLSQL